MNLGQVISLLCAFWVCFALGLASPYSPVPPTYFGLTINHYKNYQPKLTYGTARSWDSSPDINWWNINTAYGEYYWTNFDSWLANNTFYGRDILYDLANTPTWASSQPNNTISAEGLGACAPPKNYSYWTTYITALLDHSGGKIKYFELWNEPNDEGFFCGNISDLVYMASLAYPLIKSKQPDAVILSPAVTSGNGGPIWLNNYFAAGGYKYCDAIAFHGYYKVPSYAEIILDIVQQYKNVMAKYNISQLPIWDTEASWAGATYDLQSTYELQAAWLVKYYLLQYSAGVSRFIWYAYDNSFWGGLVNLTTSALLPTGEAYGVVYNWMVGSTLVGPCTNTTSHYGVWMCNFTRSDGTPTMAVWYTNSTTNFAVPTQYTKYQNMYGQNFTVTMGHVTVNNSPVLFIGETPSTVTTTTSSAGSTSTGSSSTGSTSTGSTSTGSTSTGSTSTGSTGPGSTISSESSSSSSIPSSSSSYSSSSSSGSATNSPTTSTSGNSANFSNKFVPPFATMLIILACVYF